MLQTGLIAAEPSENFLGFLKSAAILHFNKGIRASHYKNCSSSCINFVKRRTTREISRRSKS